MRYRSRFNVLSVYRTCSIQRCRSTSHQWKALIREVLLDLPALIKLIRSYQSAQGSRWKIKTTTIVRLVPRSRSSTYENYLMAVLVTVALWNNLPLHVPCIDNLAAFKHVFLFLAPTFNSSLNRCFKFLSFKLSYLLPHFSHLHLIQLNVNIVSTVLWFLMCREYLCIIWQERPYDRNRQRDLIYPISNVMNTLLDSPLSETFNTSSGSHEYLKHNLTWVQVSRTGIFIAQYAIEHEYIHLLHHKSCEKYSSIATWLSKPQAETRKCLQKWISFWTFGVYFLSGWHFRRKTADKRLDSECRSETTRHNFQPVVYSEITNDFTVPLNTAPTLC